MAIIHYDLVDRRLNITHPIMSHNFIVCIVGVHQLLRILLQTFHHISLSPSLLCLSLSLIVFIIRLRLLLFGTFLYLGLGCHGVNHPFDPCHHIIIYRIIDWDSCLVIMQVLQGDKSSGISLFQASQISNFKSSHLYV